MRDTLATSEFSARSGTSDLSLRVWERKVSLPGIHRLPAIYRDILVLVARYNATRLTLGGNNPLDISRRVFPAKSSSLDAELHLSTYVCARVYVLFAQVRAVRRVMHRDL